MQFIVYSIEYFLMSEPIINKKTLEWAFLFNLLKNINY